MKFLTLDYIKRHSRIDFDCEDAELELYGSAAEATLLATVRRTIDNVRDMNDGKIPPEYYHLALLLTDAGYQHRSPASMQNHSIVPYAFDLMAKPLLRLDGRTDLQAERDTLTALMDSTLADFAFAYELTDSPPEAMTEAYEAQTAKMTALREYFAAIDSPTATMCARLRQELAQAKADCDAILNADYTTETNENE